MQKLFVVAIIAYPTGNRINREKMVYSNSQTTKKNIETALCNFKKALISEFKDQGVKREKGDFN